MAKRVAVSISVGLALVLTGLVTPRTERVAAAQATSNACGLLTIDEIQPLAPVNEKIGDGVGGASQPGGRMTCRYEWGTGTGRYILNVIVADASVMFAGKSPDVIKQGLAAPAAMPAAGTVSEAIPGVGEAAAFTSDSPFLATTSAFMKGRILQLNLDGYDARDKKDQVIALLKAATARL